MQRGHCNLLEKKEVHFFTSTLYRNSTGSYLNLYFVYIFTIVPLVNLSLLPLPFWGSTLHDPPASVAGCPPPRDISPCRPAGRSGHQRSPGAAALRALLDGHWHK